MVLVYAAAKSVIEDMVLLREQSQLYFDGTPMHSTDVRAFLLYHTVWINRLLKETVNTATKLVADLDVFANRKWLKVFW